MHCGLGILGTLINLLLQAKKSKGYNAYNDVGQCNKIGRAHV